MVRRSEGSGSNGARRFDDLVASISAVSSRVSRLRTNRIVLHEERVKAFLWGSLAGILLCCLLATLLWRQPGDMNWDGRVNALDLLMMKRQILGLTTQDIPTDQLQEIITLYPPPTTGVQP